MVIFRSLNSVETDQEGLKCAQLHAEVADMHVDQIAGPVRIVSRAAYDDANVSAFLDREFDGVPGLAQEFPLLVGAGNRDRGFLIEFRGRPCAHAAWRPLTLRSGAERYRAAGIGLVTTARDFRGRGYAGRLVEACLAQAREDGAELAVLFAAPRSLYARLGFRPAGRERVARLPAGPELPGATRGSAGEMGSSVRATCAEDAPTLLALLERHPLGVERSLGEFETLLTLPGTTATVLERAGCIHAYIVEGKGRDLRGVIHEWAGASEDVAALIRRQARRPLYLMGPETAPLPVPFPTFVQPFAQLRILRPERLGSDDPVAVFGDAETPARIPIYLWGLDSV